MGGGSTADGAAADLVVDVDHVTTVLADRAARRVLSGLTRLGLPVAWPFLDYGALWTGGVRLGNLNLAVIGLSGTEAGGPAVPPRAGAAAGSPVGWPGAGPGDAGAGAGTMAGEAGIGWPETGGAGWEAGTAPRPRDGGTGRWPPQLLTLAPASLAGLPEQLDQRGVRHGEPEPFPLRPSREPLCTAVDLPDFRGDGMAVQFCAFPDGPRTETVFSRDLAGVQRVERVVVGASDIAARQRWATLLAPEAPGPARAPRGGPAAVWQPGYGPALEVRPAGRDVVMELVVQVRSRAVARAAFTAAGLAVTGDLVTIGTLPARLVAA